MMKRIIIFVLFIIVGLNLLSQSKIDLSTIPRKIIFPYQFYIDQDSNFAPAIMSHKGAFSQTIARVCYIRTNKDSVYNTDVQTSLMGTGVGTKTFPVYYFIVGRMIRITIDGYISSSGNPSNTLAVKYGDAVLSTGVGTIPNTDRGGFKIEINILCVSVGTSGKFRTNTRSIFSTGTGIVTSYTRTIPAYEDVTVNTTLNNQLLDVLYTWGTASTNNNMRITHAVIEILN